MVEYIDTERGTDISIFYMFGFNPNVRRFTFDALNILPSYHIIPLDTKDFRIYDVSTNYDLSQTKVVFDTYPYIIIELDLQKREITNAKLSALVSTYNDSTLTENISEVSLPIMVKQLIDIVEDNSSYYYIIKEVTDRKKVKEYNHGVPFHPYAENGVLYIVRNLLGKLYDKYGIDLYGYNHDFGYNDVFLDILNSINLYYTNKYEKFLFKLDEFRYKEYERIHYRHYVYEDTIYDVNVGKSKILDIIPQRLYDYYNLGRFNYIIFENLVFPIEPIRRYNKHQFHVLNNSDVFTIYDEMDLTYALSYTHRNVAYSSEFTEESYWKALVDTRFLSNFQLKRHIPLEKKLFDVFTYNKIFDYSGNYITANLDPTMLADIPCEVFDYNIMRGVYYPDTTSFNTNIKKDEFVFFKITNVTPYVDVYFLPQTLIPSGKYFNLNNGTREKGLWKNYIEGYIHYNFPYIINVNYGRDFVNKYGYIYTGILNFGFMILIKPKWELIPPNKRSISINLKIDIAVQFANIVDKSYLDYNDLIANLDKYYKFDD